MLGSTEEAQLYCPPSVYSTGWRAHEGSPQKSTKSLAHIVLVSNMKLSSKEVQQRLLLVAYFVILVALP